jgi:hypothetical protein
MQHHEPVVSRRTALRLGALAVGIATLAVAQPPLTAVAGPARAATGDSVDSDVPRFRFDCITPVPGFAPLHRLEEVWANPRYLTFTDCRVTYIGSEPFRLTPEEAAVVDVAEEAGAVVTDPQAMYLLILAATARIDPARFEAKLAELGRPVVQASLALAPEAPQADRFRDWLAATA